MKNNELYYKDLNALLKKYQFGLKASEVHGFIVGLLASGCQTSDTHTLISDIIYEKKQPSPELTKTIETLYQQIKEQLESGLFELSLLIIDDTSLPNRIEDVTDWVNHFLLAIHLVLPNVEKANEEVKEAISDLKEISRAGYTKEDNEEELNYALEEIIEYVRLTTFLCFEEFHQSAHQQQNQRIH